MLLNMGTSSKRKPKEEANLNDDAILGDLLGSIKSTSKSEIKSKPNTPKIGATSNQGGHSNPFAVRPTSTGIKKKVVLQQQKPKIDHGVKNEPLDTYEDEDHTALSQMIDDDDDFGEPMEVIKIIDFNSILTIYTEILKLFETIFLLSKFDKVCYCRYCTMMNLKFAVLYWLLDLCQS